MNTYKIIIAMLLPLILSAHGDKEHTVETIETKIVQQKSTKPLIYKEINDGYINNVKPVFQKKCFDCHGSISNYPWYYKVPAVKQMIDSDITEAKKHLDMSKDFPFISHETPLNDLKSLRDIAIEGGMPPLRYILGHWNSSLTKDEKKSIKKWAEESMKKLKGVGYE